MNNMKTLWAFITELDKKAVRAVLVLILMFGLVASLLIFGQSVLKVPDTDIFNIFARLKATGFALPVIALIFTLAAFLGVPQWVLITGVVLAFGPLSGSFYAWVATMCSAALDFWLGRWIGAEKLNRYGGDLVGRIISVVKHNGFITSFAIRFVPTGPFVLVNMAAGVAHMKFSAFVLGTGLGIIPKIAIVGLVAQGVITSGDGKRFASVFIFLAIFLILAMFLARKRLNKNFSERKSSIK